MAKAKKKKKQSRKAGSVMGRSDIPYAERLKMQHDSNIVANRNHSAQITMFCFSVALHKHEGIGYKRLVKYSLSFKKNLDDMYKDIEHGMDQARRRLAQHGIEISGDLYSIAIPGGTAKDQQIADHRVQASQIAQIVATITINDEFKLGEPKLRRIQEEVNALSARYAKEGEGFLLEEMQKIGFPIIDRKVTAFLDDDGTPVTANRAAKEAVPCTQQMEAR